MLMTDLNLDCLLRIFGYCSEIDLHNLCEAHWVFQDVIEMNIFRMQSQDMLMCGHRNNPAIQTRNQMPITYGDRLRIGKNWTLGRYREREYFSHFKMFASKLHLEDNYLYITFLEYLRQHRRIQSEPLQRRYTHEIETRTKTDIADFKKKRSTIFAGRTCGSCFIYESGYATEMQLHSPKEYLYCLDFANNMYVTSTNRCAKVWRRADEMDLVNLDLALDLNHSFKSMALNFEGNKLFAGLYTDVNRRALREIDLETGTMRSLESNSLSIYDLKMKDDNILYTANLDTTFRLFDRRTNRDEGIWEDPFDSSFYCLETDGLYAVLCGAKYHNRVNLYDIRVPKKYIQLYFPNRSRHHYQPSSPVHSIACDSRYLFVATDHNLRVLDFKSDSAQIRDYRNIFNDIKSPVYSEPKN